MSLLNDFEQSLHIDEVEEYLYSLPLDAWQDELEDYFYQKRERGEDLTEEDIDLIIEGRI